MIDHLSLGVTDLPRAGALYDAALAPLGYVRVWSTEDAVGYGHPGQEDEFALKARATAAAPGAGFHVALVAPDPAAVRAFHAAAMARGAMDGGAPGLRAHYGPGYYAAFVVDLDGHRIEAVYHGDEP